MGENVRETKELDIIIQIQNAVSRLIDDVARNEMLYDGQYKQFLQWKNSLPDTELIDALELIKETEANLSKERKRIDLEKNAVAEVIEIFGESVIEYSLTEIQNILKQDNLSFSGKKLLPVWVALLRGFDSLRKPGITPTLIKEVQSYVDDGLVHPEYREVKRHFALIRAREIITGCRELNNQPQISKAEDRQGAEPVEGAPKNEIPLPNYIKSWGGGSLTGLVGLKHFRDDMQLILTQGFTVRTLAAKEYWARYEKEFLNKGKKERSFIEAVKSNLQLDNIFPRPRRSKNEAKKND